MKPDNQEFRIYIYKQSTRHVKIITNIFYSVRILQL